MNSILKAFIASFAPFGVLVASQALKDNIAEDMAKFPYGIMAAASVFLVGFLSFKAMNAAFKAEQSSKTGEKVKEINVGIWLPAMFAAATFIFSLWD